MIRHRIHVRGAVFCTCIVVILAGCITPANDPEIDLATAARLMDMAEERTPPPEVIPVAEGGSLLTTGATAAKVEPYKKLAEELTADVGAQKISVIVGEFFVNEGETTTPLSSRIHEELSYALAKSGKVNVVTRERLGELQMEEKFQGSHLVEPGTSVSGVKIKGCEAIVRGRYYLEEQDIRIFAEMVFLEGGTKSMARTTVPGHKYEGLHIAHKNQQKHDAHVAQIAKQVASFPSDVKLEITTPGARRLFREGDALSFMVRADRDCYLLAMVHQPDGQSHVLFPNRHARNSFIQAGKWIEIPGTREFDIIVEPPFGTDVIQVVACTEESALHKKIDEILGPGSSGSAFASGARTRGIGVYNKGHATGKAEWGSKKIAISSAPR